MFAIKISSFLVGSGNGSVVSSQVPQTPVTKDADSSYCPLTPEEAAWDSDYCTEQGLLEAAPCFPLTPDELCLESSPPILDDINSCVSLEEMNLCSPHDQALRELTLCSPVTPSDVDQLSSPRRTPGDLNCFSPQMHEISPCSSAIPGGTRRAAPSDITFGSSVSRSELGLTSVKILGDVRSVHTSEELNKKSARSSPSHTVNACSPYAENRNACSAAALAHDADSVAEKSSAMVVDAASAVRSKSEFLSLNHADLLTQSSQHPLLMPSLRVDPTSTSTPYTDAAQSRKPARQGHIKRPMNAFMIWAQQQRHQIIAQYPGSDNAKISKFLGSAWKTMDEEEKAPYREEADRLKLLHVKEFPEYKYKPRKAAKRKPIKDEVGSDVEVNQSHNGKKKAPRKAAAATASRKTGSRNAARNRSRSLKTSHGSGSDSESQEASDNQASDLACPPQTVPPVHSKSGEDVLSSDRFTAATIGKQVRSGQNQVTANDFRSNEVTGNRGVLVSTELTCPPHGTKYHAHPTATSTKTNTDTTIKISTSRSHAIEFDAVEDSSNEDIADSAVVPVFQATRQQKTATTPVSQMLQKPNVTSKTPPNPEGQQPLGIFQPEDASHHSGRDDAQDRPSMAERRSQKPGAAFGSQDGRVRPTSPQCEEASEDPVSEDFSSSSSSCSSSTSSSSSSSSSSDAVVLQEFAFSEDELDQLFATTADEGAFINLVKYVIC